MKQPYIPLSQPCLGGKEWEYVKECLDSGWISSAGPFVDRFEAAVKNYVQSRYAVGVVNGTAALHAALLTIGLQAGEAVIVSNLTFVAPVNAIDYCGADPILMDADPNTWQMDADKLEQFLSQECEVKGEQCFHRKTGRRIRAVLPVHILGFASPIDRILALAKRYQLKVIEDACEGMGVRYQGKHLGTFGDIGVFSFNGNKIISTGGGGMLVTDQKEYADRAAYLTTQAKDDPVEYWHRQVGYNYRLTNVHAAIGLAQMEQLETRIVQKRRIAAYYQERLNRAAGLTTLTKLPDCEPTYWLNAVLLPESFTMEARKQIVKRLNDEGIGARSLWHTIHDLPPYQKALASPMEHSIRIYQRGICLPSSAQLTEKDLARVVDTLLHAIQSVSK